MKTIKDQEFEGERPLFASHHLTIENVTIHTGESALKECSDIHALHCRFEGKYSFWHVDGFSIKDCLFTEGARAALWYSRNLEMSDTLIEAPKMFREMDHLKLSNVKIPGAQETMWYCRDVELKNVEVAKADYMLMNSSDIRISDYRHQGNYAFQYCKNVVIENAVIEGRDSFWETENVTLRNCRLDGAYIGWHSHGLTLIDCHISGTQPLCYCHGLVMRRCTMDADADLAFEYSTVDAEIKGTVTSVKNPMSGRITADGYGEVILDENIKAPADCMIEVRKN